MSTKALDLSQTSNFFSANTNNLEVEADVSFLNNIEIGGAVNGRPASADYVDQTSATGSAELPAGTTGERDVTPSAVYRQALRDLPLQSGFLETVVWPQKPAEI